MNGVSFADDEQDADEEADGQDDGQILFEDRPALVRTADGMSQFVEAETAWDVGGPVAGPSVPRGMVNGDITSTSGDSKSRSSRSRSRGRQQARATSAGARSSTATGSGLDGERLAGLLKEDPILADWATFLSPGLMASGVPTLPIRHSSKDKRVPPSSTPAVRKMVNGVAKRKRGKGKASGQKARKATGSTATGKTLAHQMRGNIAALRRIKRTHRKMEAMTAAPRVRVSSGIGSRHDTHALLQIGMTPDPDFGDDASDDDSDDGGDPADLHQKPLRPELMRPTTGTEVAAEAMEDVVSMVLAHAGFDGPCFSYEVSRPRLTRLVGRMAAVQSTALHSLTEIATHYLSNLGKTLRFYADRFPSSTADPNASPSTSEEGASNVSLSPSEMIFQALRVNGVPSLATLESYIYDDVERYGKRLGDLERKLEKGYKEMMENGVLGARKAWHDDMLFAKDGEAMMVYVSQLLYDRTGFAEHPFDTQRRLRQRTRRRLLGHAGAWSGGRAGDGVDADTLQAVPRQGERRRPYRRRNVRLSPRDSSRMFSDLHFRATTEEEPRFVQPPPFVALTAPAIEGQIGLLQPFFRIRAQHPDFELLEDDQPPKAKLPKLFRPKVPPSGKIPIKRKAAPVGGHTASPGTVGGTPMAMTASSQGGDLVDKDASAKKRKKGD